MATLRAAIKAALAGDGTLAAILTGGMYDRRGISRTATPSAYNATGELMPCGVVTLETTTTHGPKEFNFERAFVVVYLYEEEGNAYAAIDPAADRIRALLHRQTVTTTPSLVWEILHTDSIGDQYDDVLRAEMRMERFQVWRKRVV